MFRFPGGLLGKQSFGPLFFNLWLNFCGGLRAFAAVLNSSGSSPPNTEVVCSFQSYSGLPRMSDIAGEEYERLAQDAAMAAAAAADREPEPANWGLYSFDDGPPCIGGGVGGFVWFETRDELALFIKSRLPFLSGRRPDRDAWLGVRTDLAVETDAWAAGHILTSELINRVNCTLAQLVRIEWIGQFSSLLVDESPWEREIRSMFRGSQNRSEQGMPISDEEVTGFVGFLSACGL